MDELRRVCAEVAGRARDVRIRHAAIPGYAASLAVGEAPGEAAISDETPAGLDTGGRAAFWLTLDAINFGSGWFPTLRKRDGRSGYNTIALAWREHHAAHGAFTASALRQLDPPAVAGILGQDRGHELMALYAESLRDLGDRLHHGYGGDYRALVSGAHGSAVALAETLGSWRCFADVSAYDELSVPFLKRAQIAAADLERAGVARWDDPERLTMFADNLVPHVLRLDGVLEFSAPLEARIEAEAPIVHGSREEVEIRACALHAVELIVAARRGGGAGVTAARIDQLLWQRGQLPRYKAVSRHRSRCTAY